jgi:peptide/nickel transport system permease protein
MTRFLIRRSLQNLLLLIVMSVITFTLLHVAPNSPFVIEGDPNQSQADIARLRANYGLDQPLPVQYALWVGRLVQGDLGRSFATPEPVARLIWDRLPATVLLAVSALVLSFGIGVPMGIYAAVHRGTWLDNAIRVFSVVVDATPRFWLGLLAIVVLGGQLGWFPQGGMYDLAKRDQFDPIDRLRHLALPALILASAGWVGLSRVMRGETLEVLHQDYVRTALGKGLRWHAVLWGHVVRNALLPLVTSVAGILPGLVSGAALVEIVFSWPGLGRLALDSALRHDFPVILANWLIISLLVLLGRMISDVLYAVVDPRVRLA